MKLGRATVVLVLLFEAATPVGSEDSALREARQFFIREAFRSARVRGEQALAQAESSHDDQGRIAALRLLADIADGRGEPREAEGKRDEAAILARTLGDIPAQAWIHIDQASGHWQRGENEAASAALLSALRLIRARGDLLAEGAALSMRGKIAYKKGAYSGARIDLNRALSLFRKAGDVFREVDTLINLGLCTLDQRDYSQALDFFRRARDRGRATGDFFGEAEGARHIAITWLFQDAPEQALATLGPYLARAEQAGDSGLAMKLRHITANAKRAGEDHLGAIDEDARVLAFYEAEDNRRQAAWVHYRRGRSEAGLGRLEDAQTSLQKAVDLWEEIEERRPLAYGLYEKGKLEVRLGRDQEARATFGRALTLQNEIQLPYRSLLLGDMAFLEARGGNSIRAGEYAREAVAEASKTLNLEMIWRAFYRRAQVERLAGNPEGALASLRASLATIEELRENVPANDEARIGFLESKQAVFAETVLLLVELQRYEEALVVSERARARALADLLGDETGSRPGERRMDLSSLLEETRRRRATFIEYAVGERGSAVIVLGPAGAVHGAQVQGTADDLARAVERVRSAIREHRDARPLLSELYRILVAPVAEWLPRDPEALVTVVPQGSLFLLPFAALVDEAGNYLIEKHTLSTTPAIHTLSGLAARRRNPHREVLVVGPPSQSASGSEMFSALAGAEEEARTVALLYPKGSATLLSGDTATEKRVRGLLPEARVIHIATHVVVKDDAPLDGFIALAGGASRRKDDDGRLLARDLFRMRLEADLVVLSGCDTGVGKIRGEGVLGLTRSFLQAGASSVVASLWRVADPVGRPFMEQFHRELRTGRGKASALRAAQIETLRMLERAQLRGVRGEPLAASPLYWAPFFLIGEDL